MVDVKYLYKGLCGLARAHRANGMAGHLGAAVVAGYFLGEELPDLDGRVYEAIEKDLERIMQGAESLWYDVKSAGISIPDLFEPFPDERARSQPFSPTGLAPITTELATNVDKMRQSGHNVIFSSIAIRALHDHPQFATEEIVAGIGKLIAKFNNAGPGRGYYGKKLGWISGNEITLDERNDFPPYRNQQEMVELVIDELIQTGSLRRQGFGELFHLINHAAAITELSRFGHDELSQRALAAHHYHVRLLRSLPDVEQELGPLKSAKHDPRKPEYWEDKDSSQWSAHLTHRIKTLFGFSTLLRLLESDSKKKQAEEKFLYLMA